MWLRLAVLDFLLNFVTMAFRLRSRSDEIVLPMGRLSVEGEFEFSELGRKDFWLCVDYEMSTDSNESFWIKSRHRRHIRRHRPLPIPKYPKEYPKECGEIADRHNPSWFAINGQWLSERIAQIRFANNSPSLSPTEWKPQFLSPKPSGRWTLNIQPNLKTGIADFDGIAQIPIETPKRSSTIRVRLRGFGVRLRHLAIPLPSGDSALDSFVPFYEELPLFFE